MKYILVVAVLLTSAAGYAQERSFVEDRIASVSYSYSSGDTFSNFPVGGEYIEATTTPAAISLDNTKFSFSANKSSNSFSQVHDLVESSYLSPSGMWLFGSIALGFFAMWSNRIRSS